MSRKTAPATRRGSGDSGDAAVELIILALPVAFLLVLVIAFGRVGAAASAISAAAHDAARQASRARSPAAAQAAAVSSARSALSRDRLACTPAVTVNTSAFSRPAGEVAFVSATVTCTVRLADLGMPGLPGLPGSKTLRASFRSPLDPYRVR